MSRALLAVVLCGAAGPAAAGPREAIDRGVAYLKAKYAGGAAAGPLVGDGGGHAAGEAMLAGLAMLEGGAPADDPAVQAVAARVRATCAADTKTYHVALSVLFLDRLGDPADRPLVQLQGVKLYAGLLAGGGYTYECGPALPTGGTVLETLPAAPPPPRDSKPPPGGFQKPPAPAKKGNADPPPTGLHPAVEPLFRRAQLAVRAGRAAGDGDNSNTQFGLIGLWVAARNGLPADDAFALIERRFLATQNPDAGWSYSGGSQSTPAMTCAGLLGLAVGAGRHSSTPPDRKGPPPRAGDGFAPAPKDPKKADGPPLEGVRNKRAVGAALAALGAVVRGSPGGRLNNFVGIGNEYYLLWSVERVAMTYNLPTLGEADWYQWGCDFLLPAQQADGSWPAVGLCPGDVDTCLAVLFLTKSNVVSDLSAKLGPPGDTTLRAGGGGLPPAMTAPRKDPPAKPGDKPPATGDPLADASDADFPGKLAAVRDAKGGENTLALAKAIPLLAGDRQSQARAALADRLTRMTANTLRGMLKDGADEVRRAACTAAAKKGDKTLLPELADLVTHPTDGVWAAARDALKALTGQDHGPPAGADAAARAKAQAAWRAAIK